MIGSDDNISISIKLHFIIIMVTEEAAFSPCSAFECVARNMEVDERHNGSIMDEGLTRPQMGHATAGTRMLRLVSRAFSTLEGADGHKVVLPGTPRKCVGTSAGLLHPVAFAFSIPYGGPVAANDHRFRIAREEDASVHASMCNFLNERIFFFFFL